MSKGRKILPHRPSDLVLLSSLSSCSDHSVTSFTSLILNNHVTQSNFVMSGMGSSMLEDGGVVMLMGGVMAIGKEEVDVDELGEEGCCCC